MHIVEALVDLSKGAVVSDVFVDLDLALEVICVIVSNGPFDSGGYIVPSTRPGSSVRPLTPPKAVPRQVRPVTSWNLCTVC